MHCKSEVCGATRDWIAGARSFTAEIDPLTGTPRVQDRRLLIPGE